MATTTTVTLLFTDLVGSTELLDRLGDDAAELVRRRHFAILREAVAAQGGQEVKNLGDGLMVVFRSAVDAVACAVAMQRAIHRHNAGPGPRLDVRVGLHVGEPIREEDDYFGMPVVVAERLCGRAAGGQIIVSDPVRELVTGRVDHEFRRLEPLTLKGLVAPMPASEVRWAPSTAPVAAALPPDLALADRAFFVARHEELDRLTTAWKEAGTGVTRTVLLAGEAGIGKTSLAAEVARRAHGEGWTVLYGRCDEEPGLTYQPFAEALRAYVGAVASDDLMELAPGELAGIAHLVPEVATRVPGLPEAPRGDRESERYRMFEAVVRLLTTAARRSPVLLVLDDLHWAAKPSVLLLRHLVRSASEVPLMILGTYRDSDLRRGQGLADVLADLRRESSVERVSLDGLDLDGVGAFVAAATGNVDADFDSDLARTLHRETEGHPFFLREVIDHLADAGVLADNEGTWALTTDLAELGIPEGVREVVGRRLSALSPAANRILAVAAVAGPTFLYRVLEEVNDSSDDPDEVLDALDEAVAARLVVEARDRPGAYMFSHALIRQVLLAELSSARRARLHHRVATATERAWPVDDETLAALAHHFAEGGDAAKAAEYAMRAAARASHELAFEEAAAHLERGLLAQDLDDPPDELRRADLLLALAEARLDAGDVDGHKQAALDAAVAARRAGAPDRLGQAAALHMHLSVVGTPDPVAGALCEEALAALGEREPALRARVQASLAYYRALSEGQAEQAAELAADALALARREHHPPDGLGDNARADALALALFVRAICLTGTLNVDERIALAGELLALGGDTGNPVYSFLGYRVRAPARMEIADIAGFAADVDALEELGTETRSWYSLALVAEWRAMRSMMIGDFDAAERHITEVVERGGRDSNFLNVWTTQLFFWHRERGSLESIYEPTRAAVEANPGLVAFASGLALMEAELGRLDNARALFERFALDGFATVPRDATFTATLSVLIEVCALLGDGDRARELYGLLAPRRGRLLVWVWGIACAGAVDRFLGTLAATYGDVDTAASHYRAALELETASGATALAARTRRLLERLPTG